MATDSFSSLFYFRSLLSWNNLIPNYLIRKKIMKIETMIFPRDDVPVGKLTPPFISYAASRRILNLLLIDFDEKN